MDAAAVLDFWRRAQKLEPGVNPSRHTEFPGRGEHQASAKRRVLDSGEIYGGSLPGDSAFNGFAAGLHAAHPEPFAGREQFNFIAGCYASGNQRSGDNRAKTFDGEGTIDRQAEVARNIFSRSLLGGSEKSLFQFGQSRSGSCAHGKNGSALKERTAQIFFDLQADQAGCVGIDEVAFRQGHDAALHAEEPADIEVLSRLRFDGFVGGDHQQHKIDSRCTCEHVADETLVPRHVDKSKADAAFFQEREAQIDGDAAALLLLQAVGMRAGQGFDQRRLAVVNMAGSADNYVF
jgi:hypothetical protein